MGGHPLALMLLGKMLKEHFNGNVRLRYQLPPLQAEPENSGHAKRAMEWYDKHWWEENAPERIFLQLLGLFDRPMEGKELKVLLDHSRVAKPLASISDFEWNRMTQNLRRAGLLAGDDKAGPTRWDDFAK